MDKNDSDFIKDTEQSITWFCEMVTEPTPLDRPATEKILKRMAAIGWIRQVEIDTYMELTKPDD